MRRSIKGGGTPYRGGHDNNNTASPSRITGLHRHVVLHTKKLFLFKKKSVVLSVVFFAFLALNGWWLVLRHDSKKPGLLAAHIINTTSASQEQVVKKPILFIHFHKSGGTSVCNIMKSMQDMVNITNNNRLFTKSFSNARQVEYNCNTAVSGPNRDAVRYKPMQNCRYMSRYTIDQNGTRRNNNNFLAVEVPFKDEMPCENYTSFAIMRRPVERVVSHMNFEHFSEALVTQWITTKKSNSATWYMDGYPIVNCMVIRQLLGRERYVNVRPIDKRDLERAKQLVDKFDAFVPLEYLNHPNVLRKLQETVPEYYHGLKRQGNIVAQASRKKSNQPSKAFLELLEEENVYETMLYEHVLDKLKITESSAT